MPTVTLENGATIWFQKTGTGAPLMHLHGSAFGYRNFERLSPLLASHFEVIDFDLPGYGQSRGGPARPGFDQLADQVAQLIRKLGYERVHLHGTSFGAMVGLSLTARHPELVDRLVLSCFLARYDSAARMMRGTWKRAAAGLGMAAVADLTSVAGFARSFYDSPHSGDQLAAMRAAFSHTTPEAFIAATETIEAADLSPLAGQLGGRPVLLLAGAEDNMTPFEPAVSGVGMAQISREIGSCQATVLQQCGHYLVIEQPERAAQLITEFLLAGGPG